MFTDFGFKTVKESAKSKLVQDLFHNVSSKYDLMNDVMSGSLHRFWKDDFVAKLPIKMNDKIIDLAGGTGDIAFRILKQFNHCNVHVTICDLTKNMMIEGQKKAIDQGILHNIDWVCGNAEQTPFEDESQNGITMAFGLRNVTTKENVLNDSFRILKPGGWFYCLEFSKPTCKIFSSAYDFYSFNVIPKIGEFIANDKESYEYLVQSIRKFPDQETFKSMLSDAGFVKTGYKNLLNGLVAIHWGFKAP